MDHTKLVRSPDSSAVLSRDARGLEAYKLKKHAQRASDKRLNNIEAKVDTIEGMLEQILKALNTK